MSLVFPEKQFITLPSLKHPRWREHPLRVASMLSMTGAELSRRRLKLRTSEVSLPETPEPNDLDMEKARQREQNGEKESDDESDDGADPSALAKNSGGKKDEKESEDESDDGEEFLPALPQTQDQDEDENESDD